MKRAFVILSAFSAIFLIGPGIFNRLQALFFGINTSHLDQQRIVKIKQLDAEIVRMDVFAWDMIERQKGAFDFSASDATIAIARKNKVKVLGILQYSPSWASGTNYPLPAKFSSNCGLPDPTKESYDKYRAYPPVVPSDYASYVYMTVKRYPDVKYWQIWNEPNNPVFWRGVPRADQYVSLLKEAYGAVKRANPNALVVFGGLSMNDQEYMEKVYALGGKNYFDIMAVHLYNPSQAPSEYLTFEVTKLKQFMENRGDGKKEIWITEIGWPTSSRGVSEKKQAEYIKQTYEIAASLDFVGAVFWHTLADCSGKNFQKDIEEQNYGLFRSDFSAKPGVQKYRDTVK